MNWSDPGEVLDTAFDLIIGKDPPCRFRVTLKIRYDEFTILVLRRVREDEIHVQGKAEVPIVDVEFLLGRVPQAVKIILLKLNVKRGAPDLFDCRKGVLEITKVCGELLSVK